MNPEQVDELFNRLDSIERRGIRHGKRMKRIETALTGDTVGKVGILERLRKLERFKTACITALSAGAAAVGACFSKFWMGA